MKTIIAVWNQELFRLKAFPNTKKGKTDAENWVLAQAKETTGSSFNNLSQLDDRLWVITTIDTPGVVDLVADSLSIEQKTKYLENHGVACPYCESTALDTDGPKVAEFNDNVYEVTKCLSCGKKWKDQYEIANLTDDLSDTDDSDEAKGDQ